MEVLSASAVHAPRALSPTFPAVWTVNHVTGSKKVAPIGLVSWSRSPQASCVFPFVADIKRHLLNTSCIAE